MMLTLEEKNEIDAEVKKFEVRQSACLEALMIVQHHRGYVSDDALKSVADYLGMSATELDGIATFYNLIYRKPTGRHVVRLCDSISCHILGYEAVKKKICEHLNVQYGQMTQDGAFTVLPTQCLGCCDKSPAMLIGDDLHTHLTPDGAIAVLESYRKGADA